MSKSKKDLAVEFIQAVRAMGSGELHMLISREAGEDLAKFFLSYSAQLMAQDADKMVEHTSSLMLMGYLIRQNEEARLLSSRNIRGLGLA